MPRSRTTSFLRAALVAALVGVSALIAIPVGPVPVTLQVFVVALAALVLTPAEALGALGLYAALGMIGAPVFSGGGAGVGVLLGPTGGFVIGFVVGAPLAAFVREQVASGRSAAPASRRRELLGDVAALATLLVTVYGFGWIQFVAVTGTPATEAFALAVAPFVLIDVAKCAAAAIVARALRAAGLARA